jgi:uncharacterized protein
MLRFLGVVLLAVLGYWVLIYLAQRTIAFPAPSVAGAPARPVDAEQVWLESAGARTEAWLLPPLATTSPRSPVLLFTHGNGEIIDYWPAEFEPPREWGMAVLLVEYPGYGRSGGSPSEASIRAAVESAYDWVGTQPRLDQRRIVAYGRSLGGGAAGLLARSRQPAALILESTFTSTRAFARQFGAPSFLVRDPFDTVAAVKQFRRPVLVLHGAEDDIIPRDHGARLAAAAGVELQLMPCAHNDCTRPWGAIEKFLRLHDLIEASR